MIQNSLSLFKGYSDTTPTTTTIEQIVELIKNDALVRDHTEKHRYYRTNNQPTAAAKEKSSCPCFAVAVRFAGGKQKKDIVDFTGLGLADIDHVPTERLSEMLERINNDPHTCLCYITLSGEGIRILFHTDVMTLDKEGNAKMYSLFFEQANRYYAELLNCECDLKCKNVTRLSGLAHDPQVYFNPDAQPFRPHPAKAKTRPSTSHPKGGQPLATIVEAAKKELQAQEVVYADGHHNEYIMRMGYLLNAYGANQEEATEWATTQFADCDANVAAIFRSCYQQTEEHGTRSLNRSSKTDDSYASVEEIEQFLQAQASFRFNTVTGKTEMIPAQEAASEKWKEINDRYVNSLWTRMCKQVKPTRINDLRNVLTSEFTPLCNPFEDFFETLSPWDGVTDYIAQVAASVRVKSDQATFAAYFRKWFVAAVASLFDEEVVNHEILVLIGPQGTYKTTWCNYLLPPQLRQYFYTKVASSKFTKDDLFTMTEFAFVCLEEIDALRPDELSRVKAMTTEKIISERRSYGHFKEHLPHIASYCGTSNNMQFLTDNSNRRWLPFEIESIDSPYTHPLPYEGMYAQAYALWKSGFRYWFEGEEIEAINQHNTAFEVPNLERDLILTYFRRPLPGEECLFATTAHILSRINGSVRQLLSPTKIGIIMKQAGFELKRTSTQRGYRVVELSEEDVRHSKKAIARYTEEPEDTKQPKEND